MRKRRTFLAAAAVCLTAILAVGSLAYFTASESVENTFYVATSEENPEGPIFGIDVYETGLNGDKTYEGNTYENMLPGSTFKKDPTVENTGRYSAWVRVHVEITKANKWKAACEKYGITDLEEIFKGFDDAKWTRYEEPVDSNKGRTLTYTFYLNKELKPGKTATLFKSVVIPTAFEIKDMEGIDGFTIKVTADAIQKANTRATAKEAFDDFWK